MRCMACRRRLGGYPAMLARHLDLSITAEQRFRFASLMSLPADDADLPSDPEFRAALVGYLKWAPGWPCTSPSPAPMSCSTATAKMPSITVTLPSVIRTGLSSARPVCAFPAANANITAAVTAVQSRIPDTVIRRLAGVLVSAIAVRCLGRD
jgi:hypothetical protein